MYIGVLSPQRGLPFLRRVGLEDRGDRLSGRHLRVESRRDVGRRRAPTRAASGSGARSSTNRAGSTRRGCLRARSGTKNDSSGIAIPAERSRMTRRSVVPERLTPSRISGGGRLWTDWREIVTPEGQTLRRRL